MASALPYSAKVLCLDSVTAGRKKKEGGRERERDRKRGINSFPDTTRHRTINLKEVSFSILKALMFF